MAKALVKGDDWPFHNPWNVQRDEPSAPISELENP